MATRSLPFDSGTVAWWKAKSLRVAKKIRRVSNTARPLPGHQVDQILATARDGGLSDREQGVFLMTMIVSDLDKRGWGDVPEDERVTVAAAIAMDLLNNGSL